MHSCEKRDHAANGFSACSTHRTGANWHREVKQQDSTTWPQDASHLEHGTLRIGDGGQQQRRRHGVELIISKIEILRVPKLQLDVAIEFLRVLLGDGEHLRTQVDGSDVASGG